MCDHYIFIFRGHMCKLYSFRWMPSFLLVRRKTASLTLNERDLCNIIHHNLFNCLVAVEDRMSLIKTKYKRNCQFVSLFVLNCIVFSCLAWGYCYQSSMKYESTCTNPRCLRLIWTWNWVFFSFIIVATTHSKWINYNVSMHVNVNKFSFYVHVSRTFIGKSSPS